MSQQTRSFVRSAELQALVNLRSSASEHDYADGIEIIAGLDCNDLQAFMTDVSESDRKKIRDCVEHLNYAANLVIGQHIRKQAVWNTYFMSYRLLAAKLDPWWFDGQTKNHPNRYNATRTMMAKVMEKSEEDIAQWDAQRVRDVNFIWDQDDALNNFNIKQLQ